MSPTTKRPSTERPMLVTLSISDMPEITRVVVSPSEDAQLATVRVQIGTWEATSSACALSDARAIASQVLADLMSSRSIDRLRMHAALMKREHKPW